MCFNPLDTSRNLSKLSSNAILCATPTAAAELSPTGFLIISITFSWSFLNHGSNVRYVPCTKQAIFNKTNLIQSESILQRIAHLFTETEIAKVSRHTCRCVEARLSTAMAACRSMPDSHNSSIRCTITDSLPLRCGYSLHSKSEQRITATLRNPKPFNFKNSGTRLLGGGEFRFRSYLRQLVRELMKAFRGRPSK
jgi:hypothetical protein